MPLLLLFFSDAPILISAYRISALKWEYRYWYFCCRLPILPDIFSRPRQIGFAVNVARLFQAEEEKQQGSSIQVTLLIIWKQITSRSISNIGKVMTFPKRAYPKQQLIPCMQESSERAKRCQDINDSRAQNIHTKIGEMIALDY